MSFQLRLVIPRDLVDLLRAWKEPLPPLFPQHRVRKYEVALFQDRCNKGYSIIPPFLLSFHGLTSRLTGSQVYWRSGAAAGYGALCRSFNFVPYDFDVLDNPIIVRNRGLAAGKFDAERSGQ